MIKSVAITGASSGIGKAIAYEFARRGANLVLLARRLELLQALADDIRAQYPALQVHCLALDVAQTETLYPTLEQAQSLLGHLDCVIANAGITGVNKTGAGDFSRDQQIIQVNLVGGMATIDAAARLFRQQGGGTAVGISSVSAFRGIPGSAAYSASKAGFSSYLDTTRIELKKHGIQVIAVHPGFVKTEIAPNMEKYPFVISAEQAARDIVDGIVKGKSNIIVPALPWSVLGRVIPFMPDAVIEKAF
ncbi:SDR family NAD(P)-dependent oxidoreductase [Ketobacter sp.]|uniref:SDR family NAD(P)-dependent oxidoreductase n=1 Tax=Ketobacter sp. TaxID=2083498 RepID=UPI000F0E22F4|nr:SDR family NAD(P)-dependent oxidoreductase [Ketobacter sp.]RLU01904.1 MAG: SDR family NAD(P)-dependent oxidoreductase [Ketobacter sp.]